MLKKILIIILIVFAAFIALSFIPIAGYKLTMSYDTGNSASVCFLPILTKGETKEVGHLSGRGSMEFHYFPVYQSYTDVVCHYIGIE